jgi:hypothetical protein
MTSLPHTEISRDNKELACNYHKESSKEQYSVSNISATSQTKKAHRHANQCDNSNNIDLESSMPGKTNKDKSSVVELLSSKYQANYEQEAISDKRYGAILEYPATF